MMTPAAQEATEAVEEDMVGMAAPRAVRAVREAAARVAAARVAAARAMAAAAREAAGSAVEDEAEVGAGGGRSAPEEEGGEAAGVAVARGDDAPRC